MFGGPSEPLVTLFYLMLAIFDSLVVNFIKIVIRNVGNWAKKEGALLDVSWFWVLLKKSLYNFVSDLVHATTMFLCKKL